MTPFETQAWIFLFGWVAESCLFIVLLHEYNKLKVKVETK